MVLLKLQPYAQKNVVNRPCPKLAFNFFGPFRVLAKIGAAAYKLDLPDSAQVHPVFHVSQLKPYHPSYTPVFTSLPPLVDLSRTGIVPEEILDRRLVRKGNQTVPQVVLIRWSGVPVESSTWEDYYVLKNCFPDAIAWDKRILRPGELSCLSLLRLPKMWACNSKYSRVGSWAVFSVLIWCQGSIGVCNGLVETGYILYTWPVGKSRTE
jgi:hypothetical protein